jgi:hypothetical protein
MAFCGVKIVCVRENSTQAQKEGKKITIENYKKKKVSPTTRN